MKFPQNKLRGEPTGSPLSFILHFCVSRYLDPGDAALLCGLSHRFGYSGSNPFVKRIRNDIIRGELGRIDEVRNRVSGRDLHLVVDVACAHIERPAEDARESENVVDLIGEVASPGADDRCTRLLRELRHDLRNGICHREEDRIFGH